MVIWSFFFLFSLATVFSREIPPNSPLGVRLHTKNSRQIVMDNGIVELILSKPAGDISAIQYNGIDNLLETQNGIHNRGYWDIAWNKPGYGAAYDRLRGTEFRVITKNESQIEVSFTRTWNASTGSSVVPLKVDKRYILRRGSSGVYMYAILERLQGWPDVNMDQIRIVLKLRSDVFHFMAISDERQRIMPTSRNRRNGKRLAYPEAVLLTDPTNRQAGGEVDDKYQYSRENKDNIVHGWISADPPVGFWMIRPSNEFVAGGPLKQDLTSHVGPTILSMFTSTHYAGMDIDTRYRKGEHWKKVLGPVYIYLNSASSKQGSRTRLWEDAKRQMLKEVKGWPYDFPQSKDFSSSDQRGTVTGQLLVRDKSIHKSLMPASFAYVGLAVPGDVGSWQKDAKGYQFWTKADKEGCFLIKNIRAGVYNLYAWVPDIVGDFKYNVNITIEPGSKINLSVLVYKPPRNGPTVWEIGIPDRTAAEFFVPDTYPTLVNKLYANHPADKFRQYGLWERYTDLYPKHDLVYTIGISNYHHNWFFAQVPRKTGSKRYQATTWQITFELKNVDQTGNYTLQLALASANLAELQVRFNSKGGEPSHFSTGLIGRDNAIARHGIHGLYRLYSIQVPSYLLGNGNNTIFLTQSRSKSPFSGIMYDYIRFESPPPTKGSYF